MKILMWDNGLNTELAVHLARKGHQLIYTTPWANAFPKASQAFIGRGLEGVTVSPSFTDSLETAKPNCVLCPDTFSADRVRQSISAGVPTWGAGQAEMMEQDRLFMKDLQKKMGLPVGKYDVIHGIDNLVSYLQDPGNEDRWIKTSMWRQMETFKHRNWESTRSQYLGPLLDAFGFTGKKLTWLAEVPLKGPEIGFDRLYSKKWAEPASWGYEKKDEAYVGTCNGDLPAILQPFCDKIGGALGMWDASTFCSNEVIIDEKDGKAKMIEPTIRAAHPPNAGLMEMLNLDFEVDGMYVKPKIDRDYKYCAVLVVRSSWAGDHATEILIDNPARSRRWIKLSQATCEDGKYYAMPGNEFVGHVVGVGNTLQSAVEMCKTVSENISCRDIDMNLSALDELVNETVPLGKKAGVNF